MVRDVDIDNILICSRISSVEKNYKCFIGYMDDDYKIKPLRTMLPKSSAYLNSHDGKTKCI